jgi:hypothetical protein
MATPTLALIPTGYKAGKLYSVLPESGVGDFTVVRATEATRVNEEGLIETMGANVPRLDYSGGGCPVLLTEPQSTNLITYSEDFSNASWIKSDASVVSGFVSPDGTDNAFKLVESANTSPHFQVTSALSTGVVGGDYSASVFVKKGEADKVQISFGSGAFSNSFCNFNLTSGTIVKQNNSTATIELLSSGWFRCSATATATATGATSMIISLIDSDLSNRIQSYTGDGTSGVYIYGAMFEQSSYPTSYIKTSGSAVTRNGDQVYGAGDAATFNDSEGVLMVETKKSENGGSTQAISLSDGSTSNNIYLSLSSTPNLVNVEVLASGSQANLSTSVNQTNQNKFAIKYKQNDFALWSNGFEVATDNSGNTPVGLNKINFDFGQGSFDLYGKTSQIQYFNTVLTDSELEKLTSWTSFIEMAQAQNYNII